MTIKETIRVLKIIKDYYTDEENVGNGMMFDSDEVEAVDIAIKKLEQQQEKGYTHQKLERNLFKEIMTNADKMCAFVQLQRGIHNFIEVMEGIDIHVDIQTKEGD